MPVHIGSGLPSLAVAPVQPIETGDLLAPALARGLGLRIARIAAPALSVHSSRLLDESSYGWGLRRCRDGAGYEERQCRENTFEDHVSLPSTCGHDVRSKYR